MSAGTWEKPEFGKSAGDLFLRADTMSPILATPHDLIFSTLAAEVKTIHDDFGALRQIGTLRTVVDLIPIDSFSYGNGGLVIKQLVKARNFKTVIKNCLFSPAAV